MPGNKIANAQDVKNMLKRLRISRAARIKSGEDTSCPQFRGVEAGQISDITICDDGHFRVFHILDNCVAKGGQLSDFTLRDMNAMIQYLEGLTL